MSPSAKPRHQEIITNLTMLLGILQKQGLCRVYPAPLDVVLDQHNVFEPDVFFIRTERLDIVTEKNVSGPPDLVVEVLSDSTRDTDLGPKLRVYGRFGVPEYWVVDSEANTVQVFRRENGALSDQGTVVAAGEITFLGVTLKVGEILA